jgi:hypothetical protein
LTLLVDDAFVAAYDRYLHRLGQPGLVQALARTVVPTTQEEIVQSDRGRRLTLTGTNARRRGTTKARARAPRRVTTARQ